MRVANWWGCVCLLAELLALPLTSPAQTPPLSTDYRVPLKPKNLSYSWRAYQLVFYGTKSHDSGDLDFSVSDFEVVPTYVASGWQTCLAALEGNDDSPKTRPARAEEKRPWWN